MTLEIPTELEAQLERAARERGTDMQAFVLETLKNAIPEKPRSSQEERRAAIRRLYGSVSSGSPTVDEFLAERSEEARQEAERDLQAQSQERTPA